MWYFDSSVGRLYIERTPDGDFGFRFGNDPVIWEACPTPKIEAQNIAAHVTGCTKWDNSKATSPSDLSEWKYLPDLR